MRSLAGSSRPVRLSGFCALLLALCACSAPPSAPGPAASAQPAIARIQSLDTARIQPLDTAAAWLAVQAWEERTCVGGLPQATEAALRAYSQGDLEAAHGWNCLARFFLLLGRDEQELLQAWRLGLEQSGLMRRELTPLLRGRAGVSLALRLSPELRNGIPERPECLSTLVSTLTRADHLPRVLEILTALHRASASDFWDYFNLAVAVAVVHDVPPPPNWPHAQGPAGGFHGLGAEPLEIFSYLVALDKAGRSLQPLRELSPAELKFVVDSSVGVNQLRWARLAVHVRLDDLAKVYSSIPYRSDRVSAERLHWEDGAYTLPSIAARGGICVDQALYAAEAGKACGVPTILFRGRGTSGRHAWFGFLGEGGKWHRDAGRGREQRFAAGIATDPQMWGELTEQALALLDQSRHESPAARRARFHLEAAGLLVLSNRPDEARTAGRRALAEDSRCLGAWDFLWTLGFSGTGAKGAAVAEREALCRQAAAALESYPDLSYAYTRRLADSLRARGEVAAADTCLREFGDSVRRRRADLGLHQEFEALARELPSLPLAEQQRAFEAALGRQLKASPIGAFDMLVIPFAHYLSSTGHAPEARQAVERARRLLKPKAGTQLDTELNKLLGSL